MSNEEAINAIKSNYPTSGYYTLREALDMAIEALEKQIPKYAIEDDNGWLTYRCPACNNVVGVMLNFRYKACKCGQRILYRNSD